MKHILFIYGSLHIGGIETFLLRVSKRLSKAGIRVSVMLATRRGSASLIEELSRCARLVYLDEIQTMPVGALRDAQLYQLLAPLSANKAKKLLSDVDHVHFFESLSLLTALRLLAVCSARRKVTGGVYYQYEYATWTMRTSYFVRAIADGFCQVIPARNVIFFNESCRQTYVNHARPAFRDSAILPIGIELSRQTARNPNRAQRGKVVSIGRITSFKTYNFQFPVAVEQLNEAGLRLEYHVYGDGDQRPRLEASVRSSRCAEQIFLHGPIDYARLSEVLADAWLFVGSGTAIIEAAACGVPALVGIESEPEPLTYGYFHEMPGLDYQERDLGLPKRSFAHFCTQLSAIDSVTYAHLCQLSASKAEEFSIERFLEGFFKVDEEAQEVDGSSFFSRRSLLLIASAVVDKLVLRRFGTGFWRRHEFQR